MDQGKRLAPQYLTGVVSGVPLPIENAWRRSTKDIQADENVWAAIYRGYWDGQYVIDLGQEYLPGYGSGMRPDPDYGQGPTPEGAWNIYKKMAMY